MLELKIVNNAPQEIAWNEEEVKKAVENKIRDYKGLVFTEDKVKDAKKDRAELRKLREAFENERKRQKEICMRPYLTFENQVKEVVAMIDEPINQIDVQIKEVEQNKREEKRKQIEELFETIGFQPFVKLEMIWDERWLNVSTSISKIEETMKETMYKIGNDVYTIRQLPEFSFEAMDEYKRSLDLAQAIKRGQMLADLQKRKEEARIAREKEEEARRTAELEAQKAREAQAAVAQEPVREEAHPEPTQSAKEEAPAEAKIMHLDFRVWGTKEQLMALRDYMKEQNLRFGKVE